MYGKKECPNQWFTTLVSLRPAAWLPHASWTCQERKMRTRRMNCRMDDEELRPFRSELKEEWTPTPGGTLSSSAQARKQLFQTLSPAHLHPYSCTLVFTHSLTHTSIPTHTHAHARTHTVSTVHTRARARTHLQQTRMAWLLRSRLGAWSSFFTSMSSDGMSAR